MLFQTINISLRRSEELTSVSGYAQASELPSLTHPLPTRRFLTSWDGTLCGARRTVLQSCLFQLYLSSVC
jgi:hypothetical protein